MTEARAARSTLVVAALFLAAVAIRLALTWGQDEPVLFADEAAPFLIARLLTGQTPLPTMGDDAFYHVGYAALVAPGVALFGPIGAYRTAMVLNAVLLASVVPLVHAYARHVLGAPRRLALVAAVLTSLYPAFLLEAGFTWAEAAVVPAVLATVVAFQRFAGRRTASAAAIYAASAVAAYAVHARLVPLVLLVPPAVWLVTREHDRRRPVRIAAGIVVVVGFVVLRLVHAWIRHRLYEHGPGSDEGEVMTRIFEDPVNVLRAGAAFVGQTWYLAVATFGLAPLGVWAVVRDLRRRPADLGRLFTLATVGALLAVSSLFVIDPVRVDQRVYGRYGEGFLALLLAAGIVELWGRPRRRPSLAELLAVLATPALLAVLLVLAYGGDAFHGVLNPFNVLGIAHETLLGDTVDVARLTVIGVGAGAVLLLLRVVPRVGVALSVLALGAAFTLAADRTDDLVIEPVHRTRALTTALPDAVRLVEERAGLDVDRVDLRYIVGERGGEFFGYQFAMPEVDFDAWSTGDLPDGPWVLTSKVWPAGHAAGARLVFPERLVDSALWVLPGPEQDRLLELGMVATAAPPSLAASVEVTDHVEVAAGERLRLEVSLAQESDGPWASALDRVPDVAPVRLHAPWVPVGGTTGVLTSMADLPRRLFPGERISIVLPLDADVPPGRYELQLFVVEDGRPPQPARGGSVTVDVR